MASDNLQQKTINGMTWTFAKNLSLQLFGFIQGIILARLLQPSDYGLIAMTQFFFAISGVFIDSGFTSALIRNKDRTELDYSTVFISNIVLSSLFAVLLFFLAPLISSFYNEPLLTKIVRANALLLLLNSINATQGTRMSINLQFKEKSIIGIIVNVSVGVLSIIFAFMGFGVWSLILPNFLAPFLLLVLYYHYQHWFPKAHFSFETWKYYFSFGSKILIASIISTVYDNLYPLVIGKFYNSTDLGYYSKANNYAKLPSSTVNSVVQQVSFPVLSEIQTNENVLSCAYRRLIRMTGFIVFPALIGIASLAEPLVLFFITDKWAHCIPFLRVLCFANLLTPIQSLNLNFLYVKGRSDIVLRLEVFKKTLAVCIVFGSIPFGVIGMCYGSVIYSLIAFCFNTFYTGKYLGLGLVPQLFDLLPALLRSLIMGVCVYLSIMVVSPYWGKIIVGIISGLMFYWGISFITNSPELFYSKELVIHYIMKKKDK